MNGGNGGSGLTARYENGYRYEGLPPSVDDVESNGRPLLGNDMDLHSSGVGHGRSNLSLQSRSFLNLTVVEAIN